LNERGALARYAKPVVANASCKSLLSVRRSEGDGDGEERILRSMIGREEKEVVMMNARVFDGNSEFYLRA